ncbi:MAG TPA: S1 RNA-binding domain-containing protein [Chloroflexi bacterium]|nr:S1 RNA-binding domain-containing protein [Chloroflexota bacterium]
MSRGEGVNDEQTSISQPTSITDLQPKMQLEGTVRRIELYGALVDIGLQQDGLIHISQLSEGRVNRVSDVVQVGDRVTVWVTDVDPDRGRIALTMIEPPEVEWRNLAEGQTYVGHVVRIERYGVFVDIGAKRPGLLHTREMGGQFFRHPSELFREGDEVEVRILSLDRRKKRIDLTMEGPTDTAMEEGDREELPTPVELAFRKAQEETRRHKKRRIALEEKRQRAEQEDILTRTLQLHSH